MYRIIHHYMAESGGVEGRALAERLVVPVVKIHQ